MGLYGGYRVGVGVGVGWAGCRGGIMGVQSSEVAGGECMFE